jgi:hypothetical protein
VVVTACSVSAGPHHQNVQTAVGGQSGLWRPTANGWAKRVTGYPNAMSTSRAELISRDTMMAPVIAASPSFVPTWNAFVDEWQDDPSGLPLYLVLSDLAAHIAQLIEEDAEGELQSIFQAVEEWHVNGDPYVREAASIGLLEDLQNTGVVGEGVPAKVIRFLGPESTRWWNKVLAFWEHGTPIRDD